MRKHNKLLALIICSWLIFACSNLNFFAFGCVHSRAILWKSLIDRTSLFLCQRKICVYRILTAVKYVLSCKQSPINVILVDFLISSSFIERAFSFWILLFSFYIWLYSLFFVIKEILAYGPRWQSSSCSQSDYRKSHNNSILKFCRTFIDFFSEVSIKPLKII